MKNSTRYSKDSEGMGWVDYSLAGTLGSLSVVLVYSVFKAIEMAG